MSTKQCEDMLVGKGVRPTAARILVLQKLSERTSPASLFELEAELETLDKSTISRSLALLWNIMRSILSKMVVAL